MPRLRLLIPKQNHSWMKLPNLVIDKLMPTLNDTQLRVLLILIRATSGWNQEGKVVILPYHRLMKLSGRKSEAIANAIRELSNRGLIHKPHSTMTRSHRKPNANHSQSEEQQYKDN